LVKRVFKAFAYRDFRLMWLGACTSSIGTWMQKLAQSWLVLEISKSSFLLGLDSFLGEIPILLFSLVGGVVADRRDRRHLLIASQPTRGLDVGSIEYIHSQIIKKRDEGTGVLLVSSELDEILALSDRIAVMYKGRIMDILDASKVNKEYLGLLMAGVHPSEPMMPADNTAAPERVF